jgi:hypothetical protein
MKKIPLSLPGIEHWFVDRPARNLSLYRLKLKSKWKLCYDGLSVGQSVLVSGPHLESRTRFFSVWQFRLTWCGAPSLTRRWVCNLLFQLLLGVASVVTLGSESRINHDHISLSHMRLPQPGGPGSRIYIPQEQSGPVIHPGTGFPFHRNLRLANLQWIYSNPLPHGSIPTELSLHSTYIYSYVS